MELILVILGFILYATLEGERDGVLETSRQNEIKRINLHPLFTIERCLIGTLIFFFTMKSKGTIEATIFTASLGMIFSWFHNGMYYFTRRKLNPKIYQLGWTDTSLTSSALIELNFVERTILLVLGIALIITVL